MPTIMVVDDEPVIVDSITYSLSREGYSVVTAADGKEALVLFEKSKPDLVLLDLMLPELDGWQVCRKLRETSSVPIIMLTARSDELDRILGLEIGADDYLPKPFSFRELLARIRAMLRRVELDMHQTSSDSITIGDLTIDRVAHRVLKNQQPITCSSREYDLLQFLMSQAGRACGRQELLSKVWGEEWAGDGRTLEVHVRWLRMKIEDDPTNPRYIQTVRGYGYRFISPEEWA